MFQHLGAASNHPSSPDIGVLFWVPLFGIVVAVGIIFGLPLFFPPIIRGAEKKYSSCT